MVQKKPSKQKRRPMETKMASTPVDERFAAAQYDPRFQRFPRAKAKVEIDERFAGMFNDQAFQARATVDKRGRKLGKHKQKEDLRKYYRLQNEEEDWGRDADKIVKGGSDDIQKSDDVKTSRQDSRPVLEPQAEVAERSISKKRLPSKSRASKMDQQKANGATHEGLEKKKKIVEPSKVSRKLKAAVSAKNPIDVIIPLQRTEEEPLNSSDAGDAAGKGSSGLRGDDSDVTRSESDSLDKEDKKAADRWARVRGLAGPEASSSEDGSSSGSESEEEEEDSEQDLDLGEWGVGAMAANPDEKVPEAQEETHRLAILDLDWSKVQAVDIFAMLRSFLGKGQLLQRVSVYPSDYGLEKMAEEAKLGPVGMFAPKSTEPTDRSAVRATAAAEGKGGKFKMSDAERAAVLEALNEQDSEDSGSEDDESSEDEALEEEALSGLSDEDKPTEVNAAKSEQHAKRKSDDSESEGDEASRRRLQLYERSRLRYYYAIVECSDVATAAHLYKECDGMEFEHSASTFDLRYVPDSEEFGERAVRDEAAEVPVGYKPPDVKIAAMLHTKPRLTWDADDDDRNRTLSRRLTKEQLRDDDFKAYLGSESEDASEADEDAGQRYRKLLNGATSAHAGGEKDWGAGQASSEEDLEDPVLRPGKADRSMELQVTFGGGLDELSQRLKSRREEAINRKNDTVWGAYQRRRREKRIAAKRIGKKADSEDDDSEEDAGQADPYFKHDDDVFDDPFFKDADVGDESREEEGAPSSEAEEAGDQRSAKAGRQAKKAEERMLKAAERKRQAELELLLLDDAALQDAATLGATPRAEDDDDDVDVKKPKGRMSRKARLAAKKAERLARKVESDDEGAGPSRAGGSFKVDVGDSRFDALYTSPDFALDPTDPRFSAGNSTSAIFAEAAKRRQKERLHGPSDTETASKVPAQPQGAKDITSLVASLKRKGQRATKDRNSKQRRTSKL